jgi:hypothetical protein
LAADAPDPNDLVPPEGKEWWQKYASVKEWQGVWETKTNGIFVAPHEDSRYEARSHGSFLLKRPGPYAVGGTDDPRAGVLIWRGDGAATGTANGTYSQWHDSRGGRLSARRQSPRRQRVCESRLGPGAAGELDRT